MTISPLRLCGNAAVMRTSTKVSISRAVGRPADEIDDAVVVGTAGQFVDILLRGAFDQHALHAADHGLADGLRQFVDALLQTGQAGRLDAGRGRVFHFDGRRAGARAVDEGERGVEADFVDQLHRLLEILVGLAGKADDEVGRQRNVRPRRAQLADDRFVFDAPCSRASSPPERGRNRTAPAGAGATPASAPWRRHRSGAATFHADARSCSGCARCPAPRRCTRSAAPDRPFPRCLPWRPGRH